MPLLLKAKSLENSLEPTMRCSNLLSSNTTSPSRVKPETHAKWGRILSVLMLAVLPLGACQFGSNELTIGDSPQSAPTLPAKLPKLPPKPQINPNTTPVTYTVTVDAPVDLKVKQGDFVQKGQVLTDREITRLNLQQQKKALLSRLKNLSNAEQTQLNTKADEELVAIATQQVTSAKAAIAKYHQESPWTDFARENLPLAQEDAQEAQLQNNLKISEQNLRNAQQKLKITRAQLQSFQSQKSEAISQVQSQIKLIDTRLPQLKPTKATHNGTITQIQAPSTGITGQPVQVKITLLPGDQPLTPAIPSAPNVTSPGAVAPNLSQPDSTPSGIFPPNSPIPNSSSPTQRGVDSGFPAHRNSTPKPLTPINPTESSRSVQQPKI